MKTIKIGNLNYALFGVKYPIDFKADVSERTFYPLQRLFNTVYSDYEDGGIRVLYMPLRKTYVFLDGGKKVTKRKKILEILNTSDVKEEVFEHKFFSKYWRFLQSNEFVGD